MSTDPAPKLALRVDEAAKLASLSRSTLYEEIAANRLRSFTVGRRRLISMKDLSDYIDRRSLLAARERTR